MHHFALLIGYGAGAVNPYLAFETLHDLVSEGMLPGVDEEHAIKYYLKALNKGVVKVISKMGISTIRATAAPRSSRPVGLGQGRHRQVLHLDRRRAWAASAST